MKIRYSLSILIILFGFSAYTQEIYTLKDLLTIALQRAETINITREDELISKFSKTKALSTLIPDLSLYGNRRQYTEEKKSETNINFPGLLGEFLPPIKTDNIVQPKSSSSWGARLDQSYSLGGREFIGVSIANENLKRSKYEVERVSEDYLMEVSNAYFAVLRAQRGVDIAKANKIRLKTHRDSSEKRYIVGKDTKTILLRAEAELSSSEADLIRAENDLKFAKIYLARLVGIGLDYDINEVEVDKPVADNLDAILTDAYGNRPEIKQAELDKVIFDKQIKYARSAFFPDVGVEGVYQRNDLNPDRAMTGIEARENIYLGLSMTLPVFEGGFRRADVAQAKAQRRQAALSYFDTKKTITVEVKNAYLDYITESRNLKSYQDQLVFAEDNYKLVSRQFDVGLASSVDYIDANTLFLTSERQVSEAYYNYQLAIVRLKKAMGKLLSDYGLQQKGLY
jgi:outer membrane protein